MDFFIRRTYDCELMAAREVEIDIFSGRPNPHWMLSLAEERELRKRLLSLKKPMSPPDIPALGFRGFVVRLGGYSARVYGGRIMISLGLGQESVFADTEGIEDILRREARKHGFLKLLP